MAHPSSNPLCNCPAHLMPPTKLALLWKVLLLVSAFAGFEFVIGQMSNSLALQADSGHMLSDGLALAIAFFATWMTRGSTVSSQSSGSTRPKLELWAALVNGLGLLGMAGLIGWEAYCHLQSPPTEILSIPMVVTAVIGLIINGINVGMLHSSDQQDLNLRGAFLHVVADVISSVGVILAAIAIWIWGWVWADGLISLGVAGLIGASAIPLVRQSLGQLRSHPRLGDIDNGLPSGTVDPRGTTSATASLGLHEIGQTDLAALIQSRDESDR